MKFSGHETFAIRDGWLFKGLKLLTEEPELFVDEHVADWLGVGRNMARAVKHWLLATGLAETKDGVKMKKRRFTITPFGEMVFERDPYFSEPGTWWAIHVNLVHSPDSTASWLWFFNRFGETKFERAFCLDHLFRYVNLLRKREPSKTTLQKDLGCLLSSYARRTPEDRQDVEEANDCPLIELDLMRFYRTSGTYQLNYEVKDIPPHLLGYCLSRAFWGTQSGGKFIDVKLHDAVNATGSPGRCFALSGAALFEVASRAERELPTRKIRLSTLGGERALRFQRERPLEWLRWYYDSLNGRG